MNKNNTGNREKNIEAPKENKYTDRQKRSSKK